MHFSKHKLAIQVDEKGRKDRDEQEKIERKKAIEKELDCKFIRINLDENDYDMDIKSH